MRRFCIAVLSVLLALSACLAAQDLVQFQRVLARTRAGVAQHPQSDRSPPPLFAQLLLFTVHGDTVPYTTRLLMNQGNADGRRMPTVLWQIRYATWTQWVALHTSEPERIATIASLGFRAEPEHGLTDVAYHRFGQAPAQLSRQQIAVLAKLLTVGRTQLSDAQLASHADRLLDDFNQNHAVVPAKAGAERLTGGPP